MKEKQFRLTSSQLNMWNIQAYHSNLAVANLGGVVFFDAPYEYDKMVEVINQILLENDTFYLRFDEKNGEPFQYFEKPEYELFEQYDLTGLSEEKIHETLKQNCEIIQTTKNDKNYNFKIFKYANNRIGVFAVVSHLIFDAWSYPIIVDYIEEKYNKSLKGESIVADDKFSFAEFLESIDYYKLKKKQEQGKQYFESLYSNQFLPTEVTSSVINKEDIIGDRLFLKLETKLNESINQYCAEKKISLAVLFETALLIYLRKINQSDQTTIGLPTLNRKGKERKILGMFIGMLPMTIPISLEDTVEDVIVKNKEAHKNLFKYQMYKLNDIKEYLFEEHDFEGNIFDVMFNYQNGKRSSESCFDARTRYYSNGTSEVPIVMLVNERDNDAIEVNYDYQINNLTELDVLIFHERILYVISQIINDDTELEVRSVDIVPLNEKNLIHTFSSGRKVDFGEETIHELFQGKAQEFSSRIATKDSKRALTYRELNEKSNQFANLLIGLGAKKGSHICVNMNNDTNFMIAFWGIIKTGSVYIPVDNEYPMDRVAYILNDSKAEFVISDNSDIKKQNPDVIFISGEKIDAELSEYSKENLNVSVTPEDSAYILYTSGTTGNPKGAENTHGGIKNRILWMQDHFKLTIEDIVIQKTSISFDVSVWELIWPFVTGAIQVLADLGGSKDNDYIRELIIKEKITTAHFVPSILDDFLEVEVNTNLARIICSGEELSVETVKNAKRLNPNTHITNLYGPTEAAIDVTYYDCLDNVFDKKVSIGKPVYNTQIKIVDSKMNIVPVGVAGEIIICGIQVAKGYYGNQSLSNEKFGTFSKEWNLTYYKTGDIATWSSSGEIEYLGREDNQVKINGVRIETSEIESKMKDIEGIKGANVIDKVVSGKRVLVAFYTTSLDINKKIIRKKLLQKLPKKWIPSYFEQIDQLPLNHNGKVNTKALKKIALSQNLETSFVEPTGELEIKLALVVKEVLKLEKIGLDDDFFSYGLDSMKCIKIVSNLASQRIAISIEDLYLYPTVRDLCNAVILLDEINEKDNINKFGLLSAEDMSKLLQIN
ncbi:non-ribosomal peptide synthetase [Candidatus Enterococcus mansonii]|uniref:non-ribosomal peptide synthetase n=1 Tax=Candidatus Enterococcus mansonii TaxID=1834181 RepID=UPI00211A6AF5|nr:non-ribosomal peptide synthetase [Enterococcus sp. 4G2_DIV0659]